MIRWRMWLNGSNSVAYTSRAFDRRRGHTSHISSLAGDSRELLSTIFLTLFFSKTVLRRRSSSVSCCLRLRMPTCMSVDVYVWLRSQTVSGFKSVQPDLTYKQSMMDRCHVFVSHVLPTVRFSVCVPAFVCLPPCTPMLDHLHFR